MSFLFDSFKSWDVYSRERSVPLHEVVLEYEQEQKGHGREEVLATLARAWQVMREAVETGLTQDTRSRSGMIDNGGKKVLHSGTTVLSREFQDLIARALAAKEVNACMGRIVAAPTAGASGIMPGVMYTVQRIHNIPDDKIMEGMLVSAGIGLIIEQRASLAGAVGGCQAETGSAAAMASGAIAYILDGGSDIVFNAIGTTLQCMLGLVCDPVAGLVEVPCVVRNASAAAIAFAAAQIALARVDSVIPVDEVVDAIGEIGASMEVRYKETSQGGLAATPTARQIAKRTLIRDIDVLPDDQPSGLR